MRDRASAISLRSLSAMPMSMVLPPLQWLPPRSAECGDRNRHERPPARYRTAECRGRCADRNAVHHALYTLYLTGTCHGDRLLLFCGFSFVGWVWLCFLFFCFCCGFRCSCAF